MIGGADSAPHHYTLRSKRRAPRVLKTKEEGIQVRAGDSFYVQSAGGGGWGDSKKRDPVARAQDQRNGIITG